MRASNLLALAVGLGCLLTASGTMGAGYRAPRDASGHPDLGGLWTST